MCALGQLLMEHTALLGRLMRVSLSLLPLPPLPLPLLLGREALIEAVGRTHNLPAALSGQHIPSAAAGHMPMEVKSPAPAFTRPGAPRAARAELVTPTA